MFLSFKLNRGDNTSFLVSSNEDLYDSRSGKGPPGGNFIPRCEICNKECFRNCQNPTKPIDGTNFCHGHFGKIPFSHSDDVHQIQLINPLHATKGGSQLVQHLISIICLNCGKFIFHYDEDDERTKKIGDMKVVKKLFRQISRGEFKEVSDYINNKMKKSVKKQEDGSTTTTLSTCIFCKDCQQTVYPVTSENDLIFYNEVVTQKNENRLEIFLKDNAKDNSKRKENTKDTKQQLIPIYGQLTSSLSGSINLFEIFEQTTKIYYLNDIFVNKQRISSPLKLDLRNLFINSIPVLPFSLRSTDKHDTNTCYKKFIAKISHVSQDSYKKLDKFLQIADLNIPKEPISKTVNCEYKSNLGIMDGKKGIFEQNILGKRIPNAARCVISPQGFCSLFNFFIPFSVGNSMRIWEKIVPTNLIFYNDMLNNSKCTNYQAGENELYPTIHAVRRENTLYHTKNIKVLNIGDIVERSIMIGEPIAIGRQPTLWRFNLFFGRVAMHASHAMKINPAYTEPLAGDFDGDEMYAIAFMNKDSRIEASMNTISECLLRDQCGKPTLGVSVQDAFLAAFIATRIVKKIDQNTMSNICGQNMQNLINYKLYTEDAKRMKIFSSEHIISSVMLNWPFDYEENNALIKKGIFQIRDTKGNPKWLSKKDLGSTENGLIRQMIYLFDKKEVVSFIDQLQRVLHKFCITFLPSASVHDIYEIENYKVDWQGENRTINDIIDIIQNSTDTLSQKNAQVDQLIKDIAIKYPENAFFQMSEFNSGSKGKLADLKSSFFMQDDGSSSYARGLKSMTHITSEAQDGRRGVCEKKMMVGPSGVAQRESITATIECITGVQRQTELSNLIVQFYSFHPGFLFVDSVKCNSKIVKVKSFCDFKCSLQKFKQGEQRLNVSDIEDIWNTIAEAYLPSEKYCKCTRRIRASALASFRQLLYKHLLFKKFTIESIKKELLQRLVQAMMYEPIGTHRGVRTAQSFGENLSQKQLNSAHGIESDTKNASLDFFKKIIGAKNLIESVHSARLKSKKDVASFIQNTTLRCLGDFCNQRFFEKKIVKDENQADVAQFKLKLTDTTFFEGLNWSNVETHYSCNNNDTSNILVQIMNKLLLDASKGTPNKQKDDDFRSPFIYNIYMMNSELTFLFKPHMSWTTYSFFSYKFINVMGKLFSQPLTGTCTNHIKSKATMGSSQNHVRTIFDGKVDHLFSSPAVDLMSISSENMYQIYQRYGIDAVRICIFNNLKQVSGDDVDDEHYQLWADIMTSLGEPKSLFHSSSRSILHKSMEIPNSFWKVASHVQISNATDDLKSTMSKLFFNQDTSLTKFSFDPTLVEKFYPFPKSTETENLLQKRREPASSSCTICENLTEKEETEQMVEDWWNLMNEITEN